MCINKLEKQPRCTLDEVLNLFTSSGSYRPGLESFHVDVVVVINCIVEQLFCFLRIEVDAVVPGSVRLCISHLAAVWMQSIEWTSHTC